MAHDKADDLTAERAAQIVGIIDGLAYIDPNDHRKCEEAIRPMIQQVRQEALREARQAISKLFDENTSGTPEYYCALLDAGNELDRLASEGAPAPIDLLPKLKDDGSYGEHF